MDKEKLLRNKNYIILEGLDLIRTVFTCLVVVSIFVNFFFRPVQVEGHSMEPTLSDKEIGLSSVIQRLQGNIERFDIAVVKEPTSGDLWVKRVVGLPGETVMYKGGKLYINGKYVKEPFLDKDYMIQESGSVKAFTKDYNVDGTQAVLASDEFFLVGDNRNNSYDSRFRGPFHESEIKSMSIFVIYPFDKFGMVK